MSKSAEQSLQLRQEMLIAAARKQAEVVDRASRSGPGGEARVRDSGLFGPGAEARLGDTGAFTPASRVRDPYRHRLGLIARTLQWLGFGRR